MKIRSRTKGLVLALALSAGGLTLAGHAATSTDATPDSSAAQTAPPKPDRLAGLIARIEDKLDRALTDEEKTEIADALKAEAQASRDAQGDAVEAIAEATGLALDKVKEALKGNPRGPEILQRLADQLGRALTDAERKAVVAALKARADARKAAHEQLIATVASITGLTEDEANEVLKPPPPPPGGGHGGDCGHGGGTTTGGDTTTDY